MSLLQDWTSPHVVVLLPDSRLSAETVSSIFSPTPQHLLLESCIFGFFLVYHIIISSAGYKGSTIELQQTNKETKKIITN